MSMTKITWISLVMAVVSSLAVAGPVTINNYSFENGMGDDPRWATPTDWAMNGSTEEGRTGVMLASLSGNTTTAGSHVAYINMTWGADTTVVSLYQATNATFVEGNTYTLTVAMSVRGETSATWNVPYKLSLEYADGTPVATATGTLLYVDRGPLVDYSVNYTAVAADAGKTIQVRITDTQNNGEYAQQMVLDNVRLNAVPEPAAMSLLALGGILSLRRRRPPVNV